MGQSGAGKTTLLNALAQRLSGRLEGEVRVNGKPATKAVLRKNVGYVHQHDYLYSELTPFETVDMLARLTLSLSPDERKDRVKELLFSLGLNKVVDRLVGTAEGGPGEAARGLSGGERKRLSIAKALIPDPGVLLLDEYTTGLDSESAFSTTELLRSVADSGRTVVATIHQPSSDIFFQFDKLCLLSEGRVVYFGPVTGVIAYFNSLGPEYVCPAYFNPAEHVMKMVFVAPNEPKNVKSQQFVEKYRKSTEYKVQNQQTAAIEALDVNDPRRMSHAPAVKLIERSSVLEQSWVLFVRAWRINSRNKLISRAKVVVSIILGLIFGFFYYNVGFSQISVNERLFLLLTSVVIQGVRLTTEAISFFGEEKNVVIPEIENGYYDVGPYFVTKGLIDIPWMLLSTIVFSIVMMPLSGLQFHNEKFIIFVFALLLTQLVAQSIGLFFATWLKNPRLLVTIVPMLVMPMMLLSGVSVVNVPAALKWLQYITYTRYSCLILFQNEFAGLTFACTQSTCAHPKFTGEFVLQMYQMYFVTVAQSFGILIAMVFFFRFLAFWFFKKAIKQKAS